MFLYILGWVIESFVVRFSIVSILQNQVILIFNKRNVDVVNFLCSFHGIKVRFILFVSFLSSCYSVSRSRYLVRLKFLVLFIYLFMFCVLQVFCDCSRVSIVSLYLFIISVVFMIFDHHVVSGIEDLRLLWDHCWWWCHLW